jgi:VWFA-related protein
MDPNNKSRFFKPPFFNLIRPGENETPRAEGRGPRAAKSAFLSLLLLILLVAMAAGPAHVQGQASRQKARGATAKGKAAAEEKARDKKTVFGVDVNLVLLHTSVFDKAGKFVEGLRKEDFSVYEDRVQQTITTFNQEDLPVTIGLLIDTSGSMKNKIDAVTKAALLLVQASNPQDEAFIISFNTEATLLEEFTNDINDLKESLDNILVGGGTALYDAIYLGVKKAQEGHKQKKALVVITDGEDRDSQYKLSEVIDKIRESDVQVYTIGFLEPERKEGLFESRSNRKIRNKARADLELVAEETGGKSVFPQQISEVNEVVKTIAHELRNQYSIGYYSTNQKKDGSWRPVRVTLRPELAAKYKVRARSGYYAPKQ